MTVKKIGSMFAVIHAHSKKKGSKTDKSKGSVISKFKTKKEAMAQHRAIMANKYGKKR